MSGIVGKNAGRASGIVGTGDIGADAVGLTEMAGGTDGQIISYDASGDPVALGPGNDGQVLTSAGAGAPPVFEDAAGGGEDGLTNNSNTTWMVVSSDEEVTTPLQPSFLAYVTSTVNNVTGDSTTYDLNAAIWTEITDIGANFVDGTYTAPVAGTHVFYANIALGGLSTAQTVLYGHLQTSNRLHRCYYQGFSYDEHSQTTFTLNFIVIADMDAADTAYLRVTAIGGGSEHVDLSGGSQAQQTNFGGFLLG
jgi:hypothetical protein